MDQNTKAADKPELTDAQTRAVGIIFFAIGLFIDWFNIAKPLLYANQEAGAIAIDKRFALLGLVLTMAGLVMALLGNRGSKLFPNGYANYKDVPILSWILLLAIGIGATFFWLWFDAQLKQNGYQ